MKKIILSLFLFLCITSLLHAADNVFTDNIGIGKTAPSARIDIRSTGTTAGLALRIQDSLAVSRLEVLDNGNVGIGATAPVEQVVIEGGNLLQKATAPLRVVGYVVDNTNLDGPNAIAVSGRYAYTNSLDNDRFTVVDISNPSSPAVVGSLYDNPRTWSAGAISVSGKYAYMLSYSNKYLTIIDISNPVSPVIAGYLQDNTNFTGFTDSYICGKYLYGTFYDTGTLRCIDVSNPTSPFIAGSLTDATNLNGAYGLYVAGKYAYVGGGGPGGLAIVDISNPASPVLCSSTTDDVGSSWSVYVSGRYLYATDHWSDRLAIVDVANPFSPRLVGSITDTTYLKLPASVIVANKYAYVGCYHSSPNLSYLTVVDVSDPSSPAIVGSIQDGTKFDGIPDIDISGKYLYALGRYSNSVGVVDISGIDAPAATIGAVATGTLRVSENAQVSNLLSVGGGLNVGQGGILSGPVAINASFQDSAGTSSVAVLEIRRPGTSPASPILFVSSSGVGIGMTSPGYQLQLSLDSAGKPTAGTWTNPSDIRLKKNVQTIAGALDTLLALHGVEFEWKDPAQFAGFSTPHMGFIAQEVEQVIPYWIGEDRQGYKTITIGGFEALVVEALRQLKKENEELKSKTAEYERQIEKLERGFNPLSTS